MTTGSAYHLRWPHVAPIPSATSDSFSIRRRTLYRALAVVVALAAFVPLFIGAESSNVPPEEQVQLAGLALLQTSRSATLGSPPQAPTRFQHH